MDGVFALWFMAVLGGCFLVAFIMMTIYELISKAIERKREKEALARRVKMYKNMARTYRTTGKKEWEK